MALNFLRKILPIAYDLLMLPLEKIRLRKIRKQIIELVGDGKVLEIGAGTGLNIFVYPDEKKIISTEPNFWMLKRAIKRAKNLSKNVSFICAGVENLPFKDETFDVVFATFTFCEVKNPKKGFTEILRVLKPDGNIILLEHVRPEGKIRSKLFDIGNKITSLFGEHINRKTVELAISSGIFIEKVENIYGGIIKMIIGVKRN